MQLDHNQITRILPHAYPFVLIDRILELVPNKQIVGIKNITYNEQFFPGHFPGQPVMPGNLMVEAMAQTGILFYYYSRCPNEDPKNLIYFLGSVKAKFKRIVVPGDQLKIVVEPIKMIARAGFIKATASVNGEIAVTGEIGFGVSCLNKTPVPSHKPQD